MHVWPQAPVEMDGLIKYRAVIEQADHRYSLWYEVPQHYGPWLSPNADPFLVALVLMAMRRADALVVHGSVSPSLLRNLEEFQAIWSCWYPRKFKIVPLMADQEQEIELSQPTSFPKTSQGALAAFSGGIDSSYTVFRHCCGLVPPRQRQQLQAGLFVHGFDIPLHQPEAFFRAAQRASTMLNSVGPLPLIPMATNFREVVDVGWEEGHGVAIASALMMLQGGFRKGLIASGRSYDHLKLPWGSTPLSDPCLSSQSFAIVHDGAAVDRFAKIEALLNWPEALEHLRVCWEGPVKDRNCCHCEKCIRNILAFRLAGAQPSCFPESVSDRDIRRLRLRPSALDAMGEILEVARKRQLRHSWVKALAMAIHRNRWLNRARQYIPRP